MKTGINNISSFTSIRWVLILLAWLAILLSGIAGGLASWLTRYFAGWEMLFLLALLGFWPFFLASTLRYDVIVLVTFGLLSLVRIEPAPVDVLSMALLLIGLLIGKLSPKSLKGSSIIHLTLWFFVVMNFVSLMVTPFFFGSLRYAMITFYLIAFAYFVKMYITSFQAMRTVILGYLMSVILSVILIALGHLGVGPPELFIEESRAKALFNDPNVFGPFPVLMIVLLIDEIWYPRIFSRFYLLKLLGVVILAAAVFLSFSRAALGNLLLSLSIYFTLHIKDLSLKRVASLLLLLTVALLVLVTVINQLDLLEFLRWRATPLQDYDSRRFATQAAGLEAGLSHPLGIGPGMLFRAHSLYARTFAEYGILGSVFFFSCMFILLIHTFLRALRETGKPSGVSAKAIFPCFLGIFLNSIVIDTLHWRHFWFLFALAWVVSTWKNPTPSDELSYARVAIPAVQES